MPGTITTRPPETGRYKRKASQDEPGRGPPQYLKRRRNHEPVSPGRPSIAPIQKKTRATGVDGTSQRLASSESRGPRPRLKVRASPGAEAGDLRRESDRGSRPRPPPGGLGGPRRPETRRRIPEQAAAGRARSPDAETDKAGTVASGRRRRAPNTERQRGADSRAPRRGRQWPSHT